MKLREKKKNFHLGGNARRRKQSVSAFEKIDKEERAKGCCLQEDSQGGESKVLLPLRRLLRRREQSVAAFKKISKEERVKGCRLQEDIQGGESK